MKARHKWRTFPGAKAENIKQLGWRELYEEETQTKDTIKAGNIPVKGKEYPVGTISMTEGTTNPTRALYGRYTDRSDG